MKPYIFTTIAESEFDKAVNYYESLHPGLGKEFGFEIKKALRHIMDYPMAWSIIKHDIRRYLVSRFKHAILYYIEDNTIIVIAIMDCRRDPEYWIDRI